MTIGKNRVVRLLVAVLLGGALPLEAIVERQATSPIREKAFRHPDLLIGGSYAAANEVQAAAASGVFGELSALGVSPEHAYMDRRSGRWGTLMLSHPLLPGDGVGNELRWQDLAEEPPQSYGAHQRLAWAAFTRYLRQRAGALRIDVGELADPGHVTIHGNGELVQIHAPRVIDGVPVRDSYLSASLSHGNLILFGARTWGDVAISPLPSLTVEAAIETAKAYFGPLSQGTRWRKASLAIVPLAKGTDATRVAIADGYAHRLVWVLRPDFPGEVGAEWEALVDAHSGELLAVQDLANYASTREVEGGVYPSSNDGVSPGGVETTFPMPFVDVTHGGDTQFTDTGGNLLTCVDGEIATTLSGRFVTVTDTCGAISEVTGRDVLDLGSGGGTDCATPPGASPGNTHASRTVYSALNRAIEWGQSHLPDNLWLQTPLPATTNLNSNCSALGGPGGVSFGTSGGGCSNTGEIAGVVLHEWGHGLDGSDATPSISNPGEGIADIYAALWGNTSCIGRNFRPGIPCGGYGDPCTQCTGVRDIDFANRASGLPHDIAFIDTCPPGNTNGPCGGSVHCEGAVYAEAVWDLWHRDLVSEPYNFSFETAREVVTRLTFVGAGAVGNWFNCEPGQGTGDGCNADGGYLNYLAADDDDGDLFNGTPHMTAIAAAFARHGIDCPAPTVIDGGCEGTPAAAPVVTVTPRDRGAVLTWPKIAGAVRYAIYRHDGVKGCSSPNKRSKGEPFIIDPLSEGLADQTSQVSFFDQGLKNGREYNYIVHAMGPGDSCFGPGSSCETVIPAAGPNLGLDHSASGGLTFLTGDGDAFLDNCEEASVAVGVANIGSGSQDNVRIIAARVPDHPRIELTSPLPKVLAEHLAACDTAQGEITLQADGLALGDAIQLEIEVTSDQLHPEFRTLQLPLGLPGTESDLQSFASKTFSFEDGVDNWTVLTGTFDRTTTGAGSGAGGSDFYTASSAFLANQCDQIRSPVMTLTATSEMTLWTQFNIEDDAGMSWYDRANIGIYDLGSDTRTLIEPSAGRDYNAVGANGTCGTEGQRGWAGSMQTWMASTFDAEALGAAVIAGDFIRFDVRYGTDAGIHLDGFWFDELTVTDVNVQVEDTQPDACPEPGLIFADGFESGDTSAW